MTTLVRFDPFGVEILEVTNHIAGMRKIIQDTTTRYDYLDSKYRRMCPEMVQQYNSAFEKHQQKQNAVDKKQKRSTKKDIKEKFRRLSALTHPDKTASFRPAIRKILTDYFIEGKAAYAIDDLGALESLIALAAMVRLKNESNDYDAPSANSIYEKFKDTDVDLVAEAELKLKNLRQTAKQLSENIEGFKFSVFNVIEQLDADGQIDTALAIYRKLTGFNINMMEK